MKTLQEISKDLLLSFVYKAKITAKYPDHNIITESYQMSGGWVFLICGDEFLKYRKNNGTAS